MFDYGYKQRRGISFDGGRFDPGCKQQRAHLVAGIDIVYNPQRRVLLASTV